MADRVASLSSLAYTFLFFSIQEFLLCASFFPETNEGGCEADHSCFLQSRESRGMVDNVTMSLTQNHAMETPGVCYLRGDVHVVPFAGDKFSEYSLGDHIAFEAHGLEGELSLAITLAGSNALISHATLTSGSSEFTFAVGDSSWNAVTPGPNNKLSFAIDGRFLRVSNNGDSSLPDGVLFELEGVPRTNHVDMVVKIKYGDGCPPLVDNSITSLSFTGLCGACNTIPAEEVGNEAINRQFVDAAADRAFVELGTCFEKDGLLTKVSYFPKRTGTFHVMKVKPLTGPATYQIKAILAEIYSGSVSVALAHSFSPAVAVEAGECLGWYHTGKGVIAFDGGGVTVREALASELGDPPQSGAVVNFDTVFSRTYSFLATYVPNA